MEEKLNVYYNKLYVFILTCKARIYQPLIIIIKQLVTTLFEWHSWFRKENGMMVIEKENLEMKGMKPHHTHTHTHKLFPPLTS